MKKTVDLLVEFPSMTGFDRTYWETTHRALSGVKDEIDRGAVTDFTFALYFLAGYTKGQFVRMDVIIDHLTEWYHAGLITREIGG